MPNRITYIWDLYSELSKENQNSFIPALFAYYSGKEISREQPTLATVAYIAALGSLAMPRIQKCQGKISCSVCGDLLNFQHNIVGDAAAMVSLVLETLRIKKKSDLGKKVEALIKRTYNQQRSAYVHGAALRHSEYHKGFSLPSSLPTENDPVSEHYAFRWDLFSLEDITRQTLLEWLAQKVGFTLDKNLLVLSELNISLETNSEIFINMKTDIIVNTAKWSPQ